MTDRKSKNAGHLMIVRLSAMGDVAMTVPVVKTLREAYPQLRITILTRGFFKPFFRDIENIEFLTPYFAARHKGVLGLWRLASDARALGVDTVADFHDVLRTKIFRSIMLFFGATVAVIDKGRADKRALTRKFRKFKVQLTPTIERYGIVLDRLGYDIALPTAFKKRELPVSEEILAITGAKQGKWVGVAPFAQHKGKVYPTLHTDELLGLLSKAYDHVFIFGGGPYERDFAECMEIRHSGVVSVIGKIDLSKELDLISNMDCMVTMDSASMHMASLVGTRVVSVWGATHPYAGFYGYGQNPDDAVQLDMECRPCSVYGNKPCMYRDYRCLQQITPSSIFDRVARILEQ